MAVVDLAQDHVGQRATRERVTSTGTMVSEVPWTTMVGTSTGTFRAAASSTGGSDP